MARSVNEPAFCVILRFSQPSVMYDCMTPLKAVLPVAGFGTRFLPATKSVPKEMLPIVHQPALLYPVLEALEAGIQTLILVQGRGKAAIEDFLMFLLSCKPILRHKMPPCMPN